MKNEDVFLVMLEEQDMKKGDNCIISFNFFAWRTFAELKETTHVQRKAEQPNS